MFNSGYANWIIIVIFHAAPNCRAAGLVNFIIEVNEINVVLANLFGYDRYDFGA